MEHTMIWMVGCFLLLSLAAGKVSHYGNMLTALPYVLEQDSQDYSYTPVKDLNLMDLFSELLMSEESKALNAGADNISAECFNHLNMTLQAALGGQTWALQFLDATGKFPSGFFEGNLLWTGSYDECVNTTATVFIGPNSTVPTQPYKGQYCRVGIPLGPVQQAAADVGEQSFGIGELQYGMCVPSTCSEEDVLNLAKAALSLRPLVMNNRTIMARKALCQKDHLDIDGRAAAAITVFSILGAIIVIGTLYDVFVIHRLHESDNQDDFNHGESKPLLSENSNVSHNIRFRGYNSVPVENEESPDKERKHIQEKREIGTLETGLGGKILQAFSLYTNGRKLLSTQTGAGSLGAVNGVRFISMSWVILGHAYVFCLYNSKNVLPFITEHTQTFSFMAVLNATVAVDSFFLLSGLLVSFLTLKELKKVGGIKKFKWGMFYFHRFWRLTPTYGLIMLLYIPLQKYLYNGPFWPQNGTEKDYCASNWWMNLLYINNFFKSRDTCMLWSWYMANDMQFYIISPLILIPLFISSVFGGLVCLAFLLGTFTAQGVITAHNNLPMGILGTGGDSAKTAMFFDELYIKPWCRIGPYVVGIIYGYLLYRSNGKIRLKWWQNLLGWIVAAVCCVSTLYGNFDSVRGHHVPSKEEVALHNALVPSVWTVGVGWVVFACATGNGGIINGFLSWKVFVPLSRLTYISYLIHPVVMEIYYEGKRDPMYLTDMDVVYFFLGHLVIANAAAFALSLVIESPFMGLEKALFRRERKH